MKRSDINKVIKDMEKLIAEYRFVLPNFANWSGEEWKKKGSEYDEIRENRLGWDITDFGSGRFEEIGFSLFTLRNGNINNDKYKKTYAEKLMMLYPGQKVPMHFHHFKMEDIINRGGNNVFITLYNGCPNGERLDTDVTVSLDGKKVTVPAGTAVELKPGDSITLDQYIYHDFLLPEMGNSVLLGEVSMSNDDDNDNSFYESIGRFPSIEEDEEKYRLLCIEYPLPTLL